MSVVVRPGPRLLIRFQPATPHLVGALYQTVESAYSPWVVAEDTILAPMQVVGGMLSEQGLLPFEIDAPEVPHAQRLKGMWRSQVRPSR
jgi:hypothetical protein